MPVKVPVFESITSISSTHEWAFTGGRRRTSAARAAATEESIADVSECLFGEMEFDVTVCAGRVGKIVVLNEVSGRSKELYMNKGHGQRAQ